MQTIEIPLLALVLAANGAPILARRLLRGRWRQALDGGRTFSDGRPLLGASKTWAGLVAALSLSAVLAALLGLGWRLGLLVGACAMLGDMFSSFIKRRMGLAPSDQALGLDQIPESLLPLLACAPLLNLSWPRVLLLTLAFTVLELLLSRLAFRLGIRRHPY